MQDKKPEEKPIRDADQDALIMGDYIEHDKIHQAVPISKPPFIELEGGITIINVSKLFNL